MFNLSVKVNSKQKSILFDAMIRHRHILEGRTYALRTCKNDLWEKLAAKLNMHGPQKDISQWKKCLTDLRLAMKKKKQRRKSPTINRQLTNYERQIVTACGVPGFEDTEAEPLPVAKEVVDDSPQVHIKEEQPDEVEINSFEQVNVPQEKPAADQDLMRGTVKIEEPELFPTDLTSENDSIFLSRETPSNGRLSPMESDSSSSDLDVSVGKHFQEFYLMEILKESRKQTALLRKLVKRLSK